MYTIIAILLFFLIAVFGTLLFFKSKKSRLASLEEGTCPLCSAQPTKFTDPNTNTTFFQKPIEENILRKHGCSGTMEVEFNCKKCGLKEVHTVYRRGCGL
jgi:hypothetical protein